MEEKKILITGTSSGIGRYLKNHLICESFNRSSSHNVNQNNTYENKPAHYSKTGQSLYSV